MFNNFLQVKINYLETRAGKVCLPLTAPHTQNRKDVNRISFLNRGYAFNCLVAVYVHEREMGVDQEFQIHFCKFVFIDIKDETDIMFGVL